MSDIVIRAEGLGKRYRIGQPGRYRTARESLTRALSAPLRAVVAAFNSRASVDRAQPPAGHVWALRDVSFDVRRGEVLGVIGRNGAGKSTLLKVLSRIAEPTEGSATVRGRVGSLLEVGTGFHGELTGRENIYLNGALLGMAKREIDAKFDAIVAFAEIERFIDTPVKYYSSGMYVRLAFAVAGHLEPEILLVDEVLAVGDAAFQKKCLGKIGEVAQEGQTVLVVSHNMGVLREVCDRAIWLNAGRLMYDGRVNETIGQYLRSAEPTSAMVQLEEHPGRLPQMRPFIKRVTLMDALGRPALEFSQKDVIVLEVEYAVPADVKVGGAGFILDTMDDVRVGGFNTYMSFAPPHRLPGVASLRFEMDARQLVPEHYWLSVTLGSHPISLLDKIENVLSFTVSAADIYDTGYLLTRGDGLMPLQVKVGVHEGGAASRDGDGQRAGPSA